MNKKIIIAVSIILVAIISCGIVLLKVNNSNEEKIQNIRINSKEGQECIAQLKEYIQNHNDNYEHIEILKIEKHEYDIIGDGYDMGMDEEPVVIGHNIFYYIIMIFY